MENFPTTNHESESVTLSSHESTSGQSVNEQIDEVATEINKWCQETEDLWSHFKLFGYDNIPKMTEEEIRDVLKDYIPDGSNSLETAYAKLDRDGVHALLACMEMGDYTPDKYQEIIDRCIAVSPGESAVNVDYILKYVSPNINKQQLVNMFVDMGYGAQIWRNIDHTPIAEIIAKATRADILAKVSDYLKRFNDLPLDALGRLSVFGYGEKVAEYSAEQSENDSAVPAIDDESAVT